MERLTAFNGGIWGMSMKAVANGYDRYSIFSKLAEYENTGLIPEEITEIKADRDFWEREAKKWCNQLSELRYKIKQQICDKCPDEDTSKCKECNK